MAVYLALLEPGDTVMGLRLDQGGHLTHGSPVNASGKLYRFVAYGVTQRRAHRLRPGSRRSPLAERPKMIVAGATAYPRIIDPEPFREIADEVGALFMFDAAHIAGLIAGGAHPSPGALRRRRHLHHAQDAARPAWRLHPVARPSTATAIDKAVFPGLQGGPLEHVIAAKAVAFREAAHPSFSDYAAQIVRNAAGARRGRSPAEGFRLVSGGTDNHLHARRPAHVRRRAHRQEGPGGARPRRHHASTRTPIPDDPRSPFVTSGAAHRHAGGHDARHDASRRWRRSRELIARALRRPRRRGRAGRGPRRGRRALLQVRPVP